MEETSFKLNAEDVLKKTFSPALKGYDPAEVDAFFDDVREDYLKFERFRQQFQDYIVKLETQNRRAREDAQQLEIELAKLQSRFKDLKPTDRPTPDNIDLLNRIGKLEKALWAKGVNPNTIK